MTNKPITYSLLLLLSSFILIGCEPKDKELNTIKRFRNKIERLNEENQRLEKRLSTQKKEWKDKVSDVKEQLKLVQKEKKEILEKKLTRAEFKQEYHYQTSELVNRYEENPMSLKYRVVAVTGNIVEITDNHIILEDDVQVKPQFEDWVRDLQVDTIATFIGRFTVEEGSFFSSKKLIVSGAQLVNYKENVVVKSKEDPSQDTSEEQTKHE